MMVFFLDSIEQQLLKAFCGESSVAVDKLVKTGDGTASLA